VAAEERQLMPTYEYECDTCGGRTIVQQGVKDAPLVECGGDTRGQYIMPCRGKIRRLLFPVSAKFVGGGWAKDGYSGGSR
jgi:putative FmdB family regulatory protein